MHIDDLMAALPTEPWEVAELAAKVVIGLAAAFLVISGIVARRRAKKMKGGSLRLVSGFALIALLGLTIVGPVSLVSSDASPTVAPTAVATPTPIPAPSVRPTTPAEPAKTFTNCPEAVDEFDRLNVELLNRGSYGDVQGMTATSVTEFQTMAFNPACFSQRNKTAAGSMMLGLQVDPLPQDMKEKIAPQCVDIAADALRLYSAAALRKSLGDSAGVSKLDQGLARLSAKDATCLPMSQVEVLRQQLKDAPSSS